MPYQQRRRASQAHLRSMRRLEDAMVDADVNGAELAKASGMSTSYLSLIRGGKAGAISQAYARAIEKALGVRRGVVFAYTPDDSDSDQGSDDQEGALA